MHRLRVLAAVLALTLSASPVLLDRCVISCEMAAGRQAQQDMSGPACHRVMGASDSRSRLTGPPVACGHDHLSSGVAVVTAAPQVDRSAASAFIVVSVAAPSRIASRAEFRALSPPLGGPPPVTAFLPLRL